jgi:hypothetical protein
VTETVDKQEGFFSCKSQSQPATKTINSTSLSITRRLSCCVIVTKEGEIVNRMAVKHHLLLQEESATPGCAEGEQILY